MPLRYGYFPLLCRGRYHLPFCPGGINPCKAGATCQCPKLIAFSQERSESSDEICNGFRTTLASMEILPRAKHVAKPSARYVKKYQLRFVTQCFRARTYWMCVGCYVVNIFKHYPGGAVPRTRRQRHVRVETSGESLVALSCFVVPWAKTAEHFLPYTSGSLPKTDG